MGKTLVARGVIAKTLDHLWDKVPRLDVIYICSNVEIARQNIARLNVKGQQKPHATRLTMLPKAETGLQRTSVLRLVHPGYVILIDVEYRPDGRASPAVLDGT